VVIGKDLKDWAFLSPLASPLLPLAARLPSPPPPLLPLPVRAQQRCAPPLPLAATPAPAPAAGTGAAALRPSVASRASSPRASPTLSSWFLVLSSWFLVLPYRGVILSRLRNA
jgi:hypothetical protein